MIVGQPYMNRTVAFLDILGFRAMVEAEPLETLGERFSKIIGDTLPAINRKFGEFTGEPTFFPDVPVGEEWCIAHAFSDSIILVATNDSERGCLALLIYALRATQALIALGLPVRGGVAHGELYINRRKSVFVGKALIHAYDLEQSQNWIGVALDPSVSKAFPSLFAEAGPFAQVRRCLFPPYEVPMKSGAIRMLHTLNWRWNLVVTRGTRSLFHHQRDSSARTKSDAALAYARHIRKAGLAYPGDDVPVPIEARPLYIADGPPTQKPPRHGDEY